LRLHEEHYEEIFSGLFVESRYQYINDLVLKSQAGDTHALAEIADFYQPLIAASVTRCIAREPRLRSRREDVESEVFLVLQQLVANYDSSLSYFSYYLSTRLDHAILNRCRQTILGNRTSGAGVEEVCFSEMANDWEPEYHDDPFGKVRTAQAIQDAIEQLNPRQQEAIQAYFFDNLTQQEAAKKLGITQASFCKRLQRGINRMREILSDDFSLE
jgi:RNA polymerase sigma factor (sigma-70 family)